jgi:hypothetical protein
MGYVVFGSGPSATHTGTGILEPVTITYSFTYLTFPCLGVAELCGPALTVATPAANATMETSAKLIIWFIFMLYTRSRSASLPWRVRGILRRHQRCIDGSLFRVSVSKARTAFSVKAAQGAAAGWSRTDCALLLAGLAPRSISVCRLS